MFRTDSYDIRDEIINQAKELFNGFETTTETFSEVVFFSATQDGQPLTYGFKFLRDEDFGTIFILICRGGGGEATCYSLEYGVDEIEYAFDQFDKLFDMNYIWFSYNDYEIGHDDESFYAGHFTAIGTGNNLDTYEECEIEKRFDTVEEAKKYVDLHTK